MKSEEFFSQLLERGNASSELKEEVFKSLKDGSDLSEGTLQEIEKLSSSFGTKDYFLNNPDLLKPIEEKAIKTGRSQAYDGLTDARKQLLQSEAWKGILSEEEVEKIWGSKGVKVADRIKQTDALILKKVKDLSAEVDLANKKLSSSSPEEFQKALKDRDKAIEKLNKEKEKALAEAEQKVSAIHRDYELSSMKTAISTKVSSMNLANPELAGIALDHVFSSLSSKFFLTTKEGKIVAMSKENPELPALDTESNTLIDVSKEIEKLATPFLSKNPGNKAPRNNGNGSSTKPPTVSDPFRKEKTYTGGSIAGFYDKFNENV